MYCLYIVSICSSWERLPRYRIWLGQHSSQVITAILLLLLFACVCDVCACMDCVLPCVLLRACVSNFLWDIHLQWIVSEFL